MDKLETFFREAEVHGASFSQTVEWVFGRAQDAMPETTLAEVVEYVTMRFSVARARSPKAA